MPIEKGSNHQTGQGNSNDNLSQHSGLRRLTSESDAEDVGTLGPWFARGVRLARVLGIKMSPNFPVNENAATKTVASITLSHTISTMDLRSPVFLGMFATCF